MGWGDVAFVSGFLWIHDTVKAPGSVAVLFLKSRFLNMLDASNDLDRDAGPVRPGITTRNTPPGPRLRAAEDLETGGAAAPLQFPATATASPQQIKQ